MSHPNKAAQMKDEGGNAALIPGSSAWGALKGGTSQKPLILSTDGSAVSNEKTSPKPSVDKSWPPSCSVMHINGVVTRWSGGSSGTNGAWSDNKDIASGWGSPDSSPIPNAGTEVWSTQKQSEVASSRWGSNNAMGSVWAGGDVKNSVDSSEPKSVWVAQPVSQPGVWGSAGDVRSVSILSAASSNHWGSREQGSNWDSSSPQPTAIVTSTLGTWAQAAGRGLTVCTVSKPGGSSAPGSNMSRDELIVRAINSQDGWGQTPIRQDTAWDVTAEQPVNNLASKIPPAPPPPELSIQHPSNTGTAIWETSKDSPQVLSSEFNPHALLASSSKESIMSKLPWVGSEASLGAGWDIPLQVEGSALLSGGGERSLPPVKPGTNSSAWCALLDGKDSAVNPWSADTAQYGTGPQTADGGVLTALLDKYERKAPAPVWDGSSLQPDGPTDASANTSPTWGGQSGSALVGPDQRNDIWSQAGASKSAHWGSNKPSDNAIWSSASLVSSVALFSQLVGAVVHHKANDGVVYAI